MYEQCFQASFSAVKVSESFSALDGTSPLNSEQIVPGRQDLSGNCSYVCSSAQ
jgi:hypothetical protein